MKTSQMSMTFPTAIQALTSIRLVPSFVDADVDDVPDCSSAFVIAWLVCDADQCSASASA